MQTHIVTLAEVAAELRPSLAEVLQAYGRAVILTMGRHAGCDAATARGVDIVCSSARDRYQLIGLAIDHGIKRIGLYPGWVHLDAEPALPHPCLWVGTRAGEGG